MRAIKKIIIHCSATDSIVYDNIESIRRWHVDQNHWFDVGYHYFIRKNGTIELGRPLYIVGAHCVDHNIDSIGICFSGNTLFKDEQFISGRKLLKNLFDVFSLDYSHVYPHNYFNNSKTCPNFTMERLKGELE